MSSALQAFIALKSYLLKDLLAQTLPKQLEVLAEIEKEYTARGRRLLEE